MAVHGRAIESMGLRIAHRYGFSARRSIGEPVGILDATGNLEMEKEYGNAEVYITLKESGETIEGRIESMDEPGNDSPEHWESSDHAGVAYTLEVDEPVELDDALDDADSLLGN